MTRRIVSDTLYRSHRDTTFFELHHWADWIELCCIATRDGETDIATIADRLREERETMDDEDLNSDESQEADLQWTLDNERYERRVEKMFRTLAGRQQSLGKAYPFNLNESCTKISIRRRLNDEHRLYVTLLVMANLHHFSKQQCGILTSGFEEIGYACFAWSLPAQATIHRFGKGIGGRRRYTGHIFDKITRLAADLGCTVQCAREDFSPSDTGDGGIDLVGWVPLGDRAPGRLLVLGQCACGRGWIAKQGEADADRWHNRIRFVTKPHTVVLIPFYFRNDQGGWHRETDFSGHLVIDRLRFMKILGRSASRFSRLPAFRHAVACLETKESF